MNTHVLLSALCVVLMALTSHHGVTAKSITSKSSTSNSTSKSEDSPLVQLMPAILQNIKSNSVPSVPSLSKFVEVVRNASKEAAKSKTGELTSKKLTAYKKKLLDSLSEATDTAAETVKKIKKTVDKLLKNMTHDVDHLLQAVAEGGELLGNGTKEGREGVAKLLWALLDDQGDKGLAGSDQGTASNGLIGKDPEKGSGAPFNFEAMFGGGGKPKSPGKANGGQTKGGMDFGSLLGGLGGPGGGLDLESLLGGLGFGGPSKDAGGSMEGGSKDMNFGELMGMLGGGAGAGGAKDKGDAGSGQIDIKGLLGGLGIPGASKGAGGSMDPSPVLDKEMGGAKDMDVGGLIDMLYKGPGEGVSQGQMDAVFGGFNIKGILHGMGLDIVKQEEDGGFDLNYMLGEIGGMKDRVGKPDMGAMGVSVPEKGAPIGGSKGGLGGAGTHRASLG